MTLYLFFFIFIISYFYKKYFKNTNSKLIIIISTLLTLLGSIIFFIWSKNDLQYKHISFISISIYSSCSSLGLMPLMGLAFVISPENYEGSVYSLFSSSASIGACFSLLFNSFLVNLFNINESNFINFHQMILFYSILHIVPLIPLIFISDIYLTHVKKNDVKEVKIEMQNAN